MRERKSENMAQGVITEIRRRKLCRASAGDQELPPITHMAFGSGGVDVYGNVIETTGAETALGAELTQSVVTQGGSTTTPRTGNKTIVPANRYVTGNIVVAGDANLKAANIKKNTTIFGVKGTFQGYVDSPYFIYNQGVWAGLQTKGITNTKSGEGVFTGEESNFLYLSGSTYKCPFMAARINSIFNLTDYNYIKCKIYNNSSYAPDNKLSYIYLGVSTNNNVTTETGFMAIVKTLHIFSKYEERTLILNVSSLTGDYYIYVGAAGTGDYWSGAKTVQIPSICVSTT